MSDSWDKIMVNYLKLFNGPNVMIYQKIFADTKKMDDIYDILKNKYSLSPLVETEIRRTRTHTKGSNNINMFGWGINHEPIPEHVKFGKMILLLNKLYYKNILSLKNPSFHAIEHFKNVKVSDTLAEVIYKLCKNENISKNLINTLNLDEKELLDTMLYMSGLHETINNDRPDHIKKLRDELKICEGEITAGNDNPEVIKKLKQILMKLYHLGIISIVMFVSTLNYLNKNLIMYHYLYFNF